MSATASGILATTAPTGDAGPVSPKALRKAIREGRHQGTTTGFAPGYLQGNLAILPAELADSFLRFCVQNPKPCPVIGMAAPGSPHIAALGEDLDVRSDLPGYRIFSPDGTFRQTRDLTEVWRDDLVTFVLGCSFSFEDAIQRAGIPLRHLMAGKGVPMYVTNIETTPAGPFHGPLVVSMRSFTPADAIQAVLISDRYPYAHGAPVHIGDPAAIGIEDLTVPDFGDAPLLEEGDTPVFWACGVTPQIAIKNAAPELAITHEPGLMLVTDLPADVAESPLSRNPNPTGKS